MSLSLSFQRYSQILAKKSQTVTEWHFAHLMRVVYEVHRNTWHEKIRMVGNQMAAKNYFNTTSERDKSRSTHETKSSK